MKGLKRASKAAMSLWLSAVMTVMPAAGGMISPAYGMEVSEHVERAEAGNSGAAQDGTGLEPGNQSSVDQGGQIGGGGDHSLNQDNAGRGGKNQQDSGKEQIASRDSGQEQDSQGGLGQGTGSQGGLGQEPGSQGGSSQEPGNQDSSGQGAGSQGGSGQEPGSQDGSGQGTESQGGSGQEPGSQDGSGQGTGSQSGSSQEPSQNQGTQGQTGNPQGGHSGAEGTLPEETKPEETPSDNGHSGGIRPEETLPVETRPEETAPGGSQSGLIRPEETLPEETPSEETSADENQPSEETLAGETAESGQAPQAQETTVQESATNPELIPPETQAKKQMSEEDMTLTKEIGGVRITVEAEAGVLPEDTRLSVKRIEGAEDLEKIEQAIGRAKEEDTAENAGRQIYAFDISLYSGDEEIEPDDDVTVTILLPENVSGRENLQADLFHLDDRLEEAIQLEADLDGAAVTAPVSHFSPFVLTVAAAAKEDGYVEAGADMTVAHALENLTGEEISRAGGEVTVCLTGDTQDENEVFIPRDKGIERIVVTGKDGVDYKIGKSSYGAILFANGVPLRLEHGKLTCLYGGGKNIALDSTDITITGGVFLGKDGALAKTIVGGSLADQRDADISISGSCNITIEGNQNLKVTNIYAGSVTNAPNITALTGETNLLIRDSSVACCVICGGSFVWSGSDNSVLDAGSTNLVFEDSTITIGYWDFTFSIYGGHMGNDEVKNLRMNCDSTNITVVNTDIVNDDGGEIFGGSYDTSTDGTDTVTVGRVEINLKGSAVNGVFGGGYYDEQCFATTESVEINIDSCEIKPSKAFGMPVIFGGCLYLSRKDYGQIPQLGAADIHLSGGLTRENESGPIIIYAEGYGEVGDNVISVSPGESHLALDQPIRAQVDSLDLDSRWDDVTVFFDNGKSTVITEYADYADLIEQIRGAAPLPEPEEEPGKVEQKPAPEQVETPEAPEGADIAPEELETKKNAAVEEVVRAIADTAANNTVPSLNAALESLDGVKPGDQVSTYLKIDITDIELSAAEQNGEVAVVPHKLVLDVTPVMKVIPGDTGEAQTKIISNDQLSGGRIEFLVGVPDSVTASRARVIHHAASGDHSYEVAVEQGASGKFLRLYANEFSAFEVEFLAGAEPEPDVPSHQPDPAPGTRTTGGSDDSPAVSGRWVQDARGWWYQYNNGTWPREQWAYLTYGDRYSWYFFDEDGYMKDGWLFWNGNWYYLHKNPDGTRGHMCVGWQQIEGKWYYFETDPGKNQGKLYVNCKTPGGYTVGPDGSWTGETD